MIARTEAVVLKSMKYGDTSRIVTLLTSDFGRIAVIAKGARAKNSRFGSVLDLMNHLQVVFYKNDRRDLHVLSQCELVRCYSGLTGDLHRLSRSMSILELASTISRSGEDGRTLFDAVIDSLERIDSGEEEAGTALLVFQFQLLRILGIQPELHICSACGGPLGRSGTKSEPLRLTEGGVLCALCGGGRGSPAVDQSTIGIIRKMQETAIGRDAAPLRLTPEEQKEAGRILRHFLRSHVEGIDVLRSEKVFSGIL